MKIRAIIFLLIALLFGASSQAKEYVNSSYEYLYHEFKNSNLVPKELREVLPSNILGDPKFYRSEISVKDGYRWVSVRFHAPYGSDYSISDELEKSLKNNHAYLWKGYAREVMLSDRSRIMFWGMGDQFIELYTSFPIK